jgi:hypothetical protein
VEESIVERAKNKMVLDHLVIQSLHTEESSVSSSSSSSSLFNKSDLSSILRFGAEEVFKEDGDDEKEKEMDDIDEILARAPEREREEKRSLGRQLMDSFKVKQIDSLSVV